MDRDLWPAALAAAAVLACLVAEVLFLAWPAAHLGAAGLAGLLGRGWQPDQGRFGALYLVWGSLATTGLALAVAVPLGVGSALWSEELAGAAERRLLLAIRDTSAGLPPVVVGFAGLAYLTGNLRRWGLGSGHGVLPAGLGLAVVVLPQIWLGAATALAGVGADLRAGSAALGARPEETLWRLLLPAARRDLAAAVALGGARALGEGMVVVMLVGNSPHWPALLAPTGTVSAELVLDLAGAPPGSSWYAAMAALGLGLLVASWIRG